MYSDPKKKVKRLFEQVAQIRFAAACRAVLRERSPRAWTIVRIASARRAI